MKELFIATSQTLIEVELATMEARLGTLVTAPSYPRAYVRADPPHPIHPFRDCVNIESSARRKHCHTSVAL